LKAYFKEADPNFNVKSRITGQFPVSIRGPEYKKTSLKGGEPTNAISYGYFNFEFDVKSRIDLVWKTKYQMDLIKLSPSPYILKFIVDAGIKSLPERIMNDIVLNVANIGTAQLSNVPGPQAAASVLGIKIESMSFYLFSPLGLYFGILSYNGVVNAAINLDGGLGVDPKDVAKHWKKEFDALYDEVMEATSGGKALQKPAHLAIETKATQNHILIVVSVFTTLFLSLLIPILMILLKISKDQLL